jgi:hypothetical protein
MFAWLTLWFGCAATTECPEPLVDDVSACVDDWLADPDNTLPEAELIVACADAEPLADAYDAWCAAEAGAPPECAMSYEDAWTALRGPCEAAVTALRGVP